MIGGMIRCAFNAGELSPQAAVRADLDVYHRGAQTLVNVDVGQMGGVRRRRGFKQLLMALDDSVIIPYIYSTADRYLVEIGGDVLRVLTVDGEVETSMPSVWAASLLHSLRYRQVNSLLFIACPNHELMVLKRDNHGEFSLAPYEFKNMPWRYEEYRDFPVRMVLGNGVYGLSYGEHEGDPDTIASEGDMMRIRVTIPAQTGYKDGAQLREGYVIATVLSETSSYAKGQKLCINEGSYWSWWTCDKDFNGADDFVIGRELPSDYPEFFHKGIICHDNTLTCKGTWTFYCYKEWYGTYAVERRYADEQEWSLLGSSTSKVGAASNLQLTGDEEGEECYLRLMLYETQIKKATDPKEGFIPDECGNKIVVDAYQKDVVLRLCNEDRPAMVSSFTIPETPTLNHYLTSTVSALKATRIWVDEEEIAGASAVLTKGGGCINVIPTGIPATALQAGHTVKFGWTEPARQAVRVNWDKSHLSTEYLPVGGKLKANAGHSTLLRVVNLDTGSTLWEGMTEAYTAQSSGFYTFACLWYRDASTITAPECAATWSGVAGDVVVQSQQAGASSDDNEQWWECVNSIRENIPASGDYMMWSFCAFRQAYGYPSLVEVFQQRLVLAGTNEQPQTVWLSQSDDLNNFEVGKNDNDALALTLSTTTQDRICWLMAQGQKLLLGTSDAEWVIGAAGQGAMTAGNAQANIHGYVGSSNVCSLMATDTVLYIERGGGRIYQYGYNYETDNYKSIDLTVFNDRILADGGGAVGVTWIRKPEPRAVFVRDDGQLALMTYNTTQQVAAWHRYVTDGRFLSVAALPNGNDEDLLFAVVERDGVRHIEVMGPDNQYEDPRGGDFESIVITNALVVMDTIGRRQHRGPVLLRLGEETEVRGIFVSADGERWDRLDMPPDVRLNAGWHQLVADGYWDWDSIVGIKITGNRPLNLLAIQA